MSYDISIEIRTNNLTNALASEIRRRIYNFAADNKIDIENGLQAVNNSRRFFLYIPFNKTFARVIKTIVGPNKNESGFDYRLSHFLTAWDARMTDVYYKDGYACINVDISGKDTYNTMHNFLKQFFLIILKQN